jgi:hypothetical protein
MFCVQLFFVRLTSLPVRLLTGNLLSADDDPSKTIAALNAVSVDSPQRHVASWLTQPMPRYRLQRGQGRAR